MKALAIFALCCGLLAPSLARAQTATAPPPPATGVVNVGAANVEELERLPGIGEKKAAAIVEHRRTHPFHRVEDLAHVKGIGKKTVARLRPYLSLFGPTTLRDRPPRRR